MWSKGGYKVDFSVFYIFVPVSELYQHILQIKSAGMEDLAGIMAVLDAAKGIMQHNILKQGFSYCGIIYLESGDPRLAYQKIAAKDSL